MNFHSSLILILSLTFLPTARGDILSLRQRCRIALTTARTKGLPRAIKSFRHFESAILPAPHVPSSSTKFLADYYTKQIGKTLGRTIAPAEVEPTLNELARTDELSREDFENVVNVAQTAPLREPLRLLENLKRHPRLNGPAEALLITLNQSFPDWAIPEAISVALRSETRDDLFKDPEVIEYSARTAHTVARLQRSGRIDVPTLLSAFEYMVANPRANQGGLYFSLMNFETWVNGLYIDGRPLPPRPRSESLLALARQRLDTLRKNAALADLQDQTIDRLEHLLIR